ncbi:hypothetical protein L1987_64937 [Smallanthus sonchifolius]|uniref:Uncharacterized protein n=1 Tax=Smallanthus sonchifolius TaxID=185202 RepID=A0ACB9BT45_9ASTR|nr:hypothetical protein L1987_64937 [Smallanthus sonchifolius]
MEIRFQDKDIHTKWNGIQGYLKAKKNVQGMAVVPVGWERKMVREWLELSCNSIGTLSPMEMTYLIKELGEELRVVSR